MKSFFAAFSQTATEEQLAQGEDTIIEIEIWETNVILLKIYRLLQNYLTDWGGLDTTLLLELIKRNKLDLEETLEQIPYIHSGYMSTVSPPTPKPAT